MKASKLRVRVRSSKSKVRAGRKICLVATSGGHMAQLEALSRAFDGFEPYLVTVKSPHAEWAFPSLEKRYVFQVLRNPASFVINFLQSVLILLQERPLVVVTTGAGDALATVLVAVSLGIPVVFVESMARVKNASLMGRIVSRLTPNCVVQWPSLLKAYRHAVLAAPIFRLRGPPSKPPSIPRIVILTGTHKTGFDRLLSAVDELLGRGVLQATVFAQIGSASYVPHNYQYVRYLPHDELVEKLGAADVIVTHDGAGSIGDGLAAGRPVIVVPRLRSKGEVVYRNTSELACELARIGWVSLLDDPGRLPEALARIGEGPRGSVPDRLPEVVDVVRGFLDRLGKGRDDSILARAQAIPGPSTSMEHPR